MSAPVPETITPELLQAIRSTYGRWGLSLGESETTTPERLTTMLSDIAGKIPGAACRISPSSFDPDDAHLQALPRPLNWHWGSCEHALRWSGVRGVLTRLPAYWQLNLALYKACRAVGIPIFTNEPENIPVGAMTLKLAGIDTVVSESSDVTAFADYLTGHGLPRPRLGILIHRAAGVWNVPSAIRDSWQVVVQEVHALPGVPVLEQCRALAMNKAPLFHLSSAYVWEQESDRALITSATDDPLPLFRYTLPFTLREAGTCTCGQAVIERSA